MINSELRICRKPVTDDKHPLRVIAFAWLMFAVAAGSAGYNALNHSSLTHIYVSEEGSDWASGIDQLHPVRTLTCALRRISTGGTVHILPGIYTDRCHVHRGGTASQPLRIQAEQPGSVTITWRESSEFVSSLKWRRLPSGAPDVALYEAEIDRPVYRLQQENRELFRVVWGGAAALLELMQRPGAQAAFCYQQGRLTVGLPGRLHPSEARLTLHKPVPEPREWGEFRSANLWIEADHVHISGIRFESGIGSSIRLWNGQDIHIEDCAFSGATVGVNCSEGICPGKNVSIDSCLYHNAPQFDWRTAWLSWKEIYAAYPSSCLVSSRDEGLTVSNCVVVHAGDALRITNASVASDAVSIAEQNLLAYCTDDAVELDGPGRNIIFRGNLIIDAHESLGLSPIERGPCLIERNVFVHPRIEINGAQLKFIKNAEQQQIRNVIVRDNLFLGNWLNWRNDVEIHDVAIYDNIFLVRRQVEPLWPEGVVARDNNIIRLSAEPEELDMSAAVRLLMSAAAASSTSRTVLVETAHRTYGPRWWNWDDPVTRDLHASLQAMKSEVGRNEENITPSGGPSPGPAEDQPSEHISL